MTHSTRPPRPSDDELFMAMAHVAAQRSLCDRDQVGAVIVSMEKIVLSTGRNGPPRGFDHQERTCSAWCLRAARSSEYRESDYSDCPSIHAEANALLTSDRSRREGGTIYITSPPCWTCGKMIANSGLTTLVVEHDPLKFAERTANNTYLFLESVGLTVYTLETKRHDDGKE